jgi:hypothetical protein
MKITNLYDAVDDIPLGIRGVKLEDGELKNFSREDLKEIVRRNEGVKPTRTRIVPGATIYHPPEHNPIFLLKAYTHDWRLKRRMKKEGANFAYIQFGGLCACYDFYRI